MGNDLIFIDHPLRYLSYECELDVLKTEYLHMTKTRVLSFFETFLLSINFPLNIRNLERVIKLSVSL